MRPRGHWSKDTKTGVVTTEDWTDLRPLADDKAESVADVRAMARAKVKAVHPSIDDPERLSIAMVRFMYLVDKRAIGSLTAGETAWLNAARTLLARVWNIRQAADDIEAQIAGFNSNAAVFDHNEALAANQLWPE